MQPYLINTQINHLLKKDFQNFYRAFVEVVKESITTFENFFFFHSVESIIKCQELSHNKHDIHNLFTSLNKEGELFCCRDDDIFLAIPTSDGVTIAVLTGVDPYFSKRVAGDWLKIFGQGLLDRFLLIKRAGTDLESGLLNCQQFYRDVYSMVNHGRSSVLLLEVYPKISSARGARTHTSKVVNSLNNIINGKLPVYYLGHDVFGILNDSLEKNVILNFGKSLLSFLRRDGFRRVHVGFNYIKQERESSVVPGPYHLPVDEAWFALRAARKRGPYSLYDYDLLSHPEKHPLRRPSKSLIAKFRRKWRSSTTFSVVQFQPTNSDDILAIKQYFSNENIILEGDGTIYLLLLGDEPKQALNFVSEVLVKISKDDVKIGVAYFPHAKFTRSETVMNCKRALHHAAFLGKNGAVIFDAVSLNVSGDIYYAEGDLISAIREYKRGLECDPSDVNLLNSLGVAYGDMGKGKAALICFKQVLALDSSNFMALYNLGLGEEVAGRVEEALRYFEKAYDVSMEVQGDIEDDLQFQLGKLYCTTGKYKKALGILKVWYDSSNDKTRKGRALSYLGRAYFGKGLMEEAVVWLQRALRFDEFDSESMGLLGFVYLLRQEGNEIALSLCSKSVDLNPDNTKLVLYFAHVLIACQQYKDARNSLKRCLRRKATQVEAQMLFCISYHKEGQNKRAKYWLNRILENTNLEPSIEAKAQKIGEELDGI